MTDFIAEVIGHDHHEDGTVVTVRMTGFGPSDGPLMTRAKARAIASTRFGKDQTSYTKRTNVGGRDLTEDVFADKSDGLFTGPVKGVTERIKAFRKDGLFTEVMEVKEQDTDLVFRDGTLEEEFDHMSEFVSTYRYKILVTTKYSFG